MKRNKAVKQQHGRLAAGVVVILSSLAFISCTTPKGATRRANEMPTTVIRPVNARTSYARLANSPWKPLPCCGYRFVFQPYAGTWGPGSRFQRAAHEAEVQHLLTPVWNDPNYTTGKFLAEWAWSHLQEKWGGKRSGNAIN